MILSQALRKGTVFIHDNSPWVVLDFSHMKKARGSAVIRVKIRNLMSGVIKNDSFTSSTKFELADLENINFQYLYKDGKNGMFMDPTDYEQKAFDLEILGDKADFLMEGQLYQIQMYNNDCVDILLPKSLDFKVKYTEPGFKGDTSSSTLKPAKLENDIEIMVPLFINIGDVVRINTDTLGYKERVK
ncbi:elongation factor P [bacterium]|nr:elongation factor P [bacterium]